MKDRITLTGLRVRGFHGVLPQERAEGQEFIIDVTLHVDTTAAAATDNLSATVNYAELAGQIHDVVAGEPVDLIETLAQRIATTALASGAGISSGAGTSRQGGVDPFVTAVEVTVHKPHAPIPLDFTDVSVTIRRRARTGVVLALGANLGDRARTLDGAVAALGRTRGLQVSAVSDWFETAPVGGPQGQGPYLNGVVLASTSLSPRELLQQTQRIESDHGRTREIRWGARTLDIDIITFGDLLSDDASLTLPHPRARERAFVLVPWASVDPDATLPGTSGPSVAELARQAADRAGVKPWSKPNEEQDAEPS